MSAKNNILLLLTGALLLLAIVMGGESEDESLKSLDSPPSAAKYSSQHLRSKSPGGGLSAELVRENGNLFDSVLITDQGNNEVFVQLENIFYTSIENADWLDNTRYTICGHVNPSLEVYLVIDADMKRITGKYYGTGFTWNRNKDRLYHIMASPHFSREPVSDKIIDHEENVYYISPAGESILDNMAISEDEQTFAFFIDDQKNNARKLIIAQMNADKKLQKKDAIDAPFGDIEFVNDQAIKISTPGAPVYYDI